MSFIHEAISMHISKVCRAERFRLEAQAKALLDSGYDSDELAIVYRPTGATVEVVDVEVLVTSVVCDGQKVELKLDCQVTGAAASELADAIQRQA